MKPSQSTNKKKEPEKILISKRFVENVTKPGLYLDEKLEGFRLKVTGAGTKVYLVYGKVKGEIKQQPGKPDCFIPAAPVKVTIGHHGGKLPDGTSLTADKARDEAEKIRGLMLSGINPNRQKEQQAEANTAERAKKEGLKKVKELTLQKVFDDYIQCKGEKKTIKDSTAYVYRCDIEKCLEDWLNKPITNIVEEDIEDRHKHISKTHPGQANHVMRILRAVFYFAIDKYKTEDKQPIIKNNPVRKFSKDKGWNILKPRTNIIKDHQLKAFFQACRWLEHPTASDYLPFLLLTGLRAEEAAGLPWSQVDLKGKTILVKDTKNGTDHRLPLTGYLHSLLKTRWQTRKGNYVFSLDAKSYVSDYRYQVERVIEKCKQLLAASEDEEVQIEADSFDFMLHDLRRTFGTIASLLLPDYIVKRLLNHRDSNDVTQTHYIHADIEKLREPMQVVGNHILNCAGVTEYGAPAALAASKVVNFQATRNKASKG